MTYNALDKVSKAELIAWLKQNILLPPISDEQFLREAKLQKLMDDNEKMLNESKKLHQKLVEASEDHFKFMALMVESSKLNDKIEANAEKINKLIGVHKHD